MDLSDDIARKIGVVLHDAAGNLEASLIDGSQPLRRELASLVKALLGTLLDLESAPVNLVNITRTDRTAAPLPIHGAVTLAVNETFFRYQQS